MRGSAPLFAALLAIAELIPSTAEAGEGLVRIVFGSCGALPADDVRALVAVELPGSTQPPRQPFPPAVVTVDCTESLVKLTLDDPITRKLLIRSVALSPAEATVRDRVVAIAIAELVSASWIELAANPAPRAEPAGARPPVAVLAQATSASQRSSPGLLDRRLRVSAVISTQVFFTDVHALLGAGLRLSADAWKHLGWAVDVLAHHGDVDTHLGEVAVDTATLGIAGVAHRNWSRVGLRAGLGFRMGATSLRGLPPEAGMVMGKGLVWAGGGPFGTFGVVVAAGRGLVVELQTEGGYWVFPTGGLVDGRREVAVEGPWIGLQAGVGFIP